MCALGNQTASMQGHCGGLHYALLWMLASAPQSIAAITLVMKNIFVCIDRSMDRPVGINRGLANEEAYTWKVIDESSIIQDMCTSLN